MLSKFSGSCFHISDINSKLYINHKYVIYKQVHYTYVVILKPVMSNCTYIKKKKRNHLNKEARSFLFSGWITNPPLSLSSSLSLSLPRFYYLYSPCPFPFLSRPHRLVIFNFVYMPSLYSLSLLPLALASKSSAFLLLFVIIFTPCPCLCHGLPLVVLLHLLVFAFILFYSLSLSCRHRPFLHPRLFGPLLLLPPHQPISRHGASLFMRSFSFYPISFLVFCFVMSLHFSHLWQLDLPPWCVVEPASL